MLFTDKVYVQLEPDAAAKIILRRIQQSLDGTTRLVSQQSLHLTILHIGLVGKLIDAVQPYSLCSNDEIVRGLDALVTNLVSVTETLAKNIFTLQPIGYDYFGEQQTTLVVRFAQTAELDHIHANCLAVVKAFLHDVGIAEPEIYMAQDQNLQYALTLQPHVALARSYNGRTPTNPLQRIKFHLMPVLYRV